MEDTLLKDWRIRIIIVLVFVSEVLYLTYWFFIQSIGTFNERLLITFLMTTCSILLTFLVLDGLKGVINWVFKYRKLKENK